jgi:hypothetical protein
MKKELLALAVTAGLLAAPATSQTVASAAATNDHARCIGQVVSGVAGPGFGQIVVELVGTGEIGRHTGQEASSNVCE